MESSNRLIAARDICYANTRNYNFPSCSRYGVTESSGKMQFYQVKGDHITGMKLHDQTLKLTPSQSNLTHHVSGPNRTKNRQQV